MDTDTPGEKLLVRVVYTYGTIAYRIPAAGFSVAVTCPAVTLTDPTTLPVGAATTIKNFLVPNTAASAADKILYNRVDYIANYPTNCGIAYALVNDDATKTAFVSTWLTIDAATG